MFKRLNGLKKYIILAVLLVVVIQVAGCANASSVTTMDEVPRITAAELKSTIDSGSNYIVVDTRSLEAYEEAHITGSVPIPLADISGRANELKQYDEIITYCT